MFFSINAGLSSGLGCGYQALVCSHSEANYSGPVSMKLKAGWLSLVTRRTPRSPESRIALSLTTIFETPTVSARGFCIRILSFGHSWPMFSTRNIS